MMASFDWADFLAPLEPSVIAMALILGTVVGLIIGNVARRRGWSHLYWIAVGGIIFFVPLSVLRAFQGSAIWERFLATGVLWFVYLIGIFLGEMAYRRFTR